MNFNQSHEKLIDQNYYRATFNLKIYKIIGKFHFFV